MILHLILSPVEIKIIEIKLKFLIVGIRRVPRWWQLKLNIAKIYWSKMILIVLFPAAEFIHLKWHNQLLLLEHSVLQCSHIFTLERNHLLASSIQNYLGKCEETYFVR